MDENCSFSCTKSDKLSLYPELERMYNTRHEHDEYVRLNPHCCLPEDIYEKHIPFPGIRRALAFKRGLEISNVVVRAEELIVGVRPHTDRCVCESGQWKMFPVPFLGGITGHMAIDYENLLNEGLVGIKSILEAKLERLLDLKDEEKDVLPERFCREDYLRSGLICIDAVIEYQKRYHQAAFKVSSKEVSEIISKVPAGRAENFHQALQSIYFIMTILSGFDTGLMSLGRLDQVLIDIYRRDIEAGRLTSERAIELLGAFYIKLSELEISPISVMIGGQRRDGTNAVNELTYLMLEAADVVRLHNPSIGLAVNDETPEDLFDKAANMVASGYSHPAFFNDRIIVDGLIKKGVSPEDARWHVHCTCTEMTTAGCSGIWVVATYMNFGRVLEWLVDEGKSSSDGKLFSDFLDEGAHRNCGKYFISDLPVISPAEIRDFEHVKELVKRYLAYMIRENVRYMNQYALSRQVQSAFPFISLFVRDCLEKELDIERGGAKYYFFYPQLVGVPTVIDSLVAIKKVVFEEKRISFAEFAEIIRNDFVGNENLREYIRNNLPKYGTNDVEVDEIAREIIEFYFRELNRYKNPYGFSYVPGFLCWQMHGRFGKVTGATPDGRLSGEALSDSLAAVQGMARKGPTAMLETVEKFDLSKAFGAVVVNVTIPVGEVSDKLSSAVKHLVKAHFKKGGFELQFNVTSRDVLEKAKTNPEQYRDILVRVGGYSDYFVNLTEELQEEVLKRFDGD